MKKKFKLQPDDTPLEWAEQAMLFEWKSKIGIHRWPELRWMFATGNGLKLPIGQRVKFQRCGGMTNGIPDVVVPVARPPHCGLYLEMKRMAGGRTSPEQDECLAFLRDQGYVAWMAKGWRDAVEIIERYMEGRSQ